MRHREEGGSNLLSILTSICKTRSKEKKITVVTVVTANKKPRHHPDTSYSEIRKLVTIHNLYGK